MTPLQGLPPTLLSVAASWCPAVADDIGPRCPLSLACQAYLSCSVMSYFFLDLDSPWLVCCTRTLSSSKNLTQECSLPPQGHICVLTQTLHVSCLMPCVFRASAMQPVLTNWIHEQKTGLALCHFHRSRPVPPPRSCLTSLWLISFFWKWNSYLPQGLWRWNELILVKVLISSVWHSISNMQIFIQ